MHYFKNNKYYFINKFDTNNIDKQDKSTIIIYRNYSEKKIDKLLILKIKNYCKKKKIKFYLSNNIKLAINLSLDGAYIPSFNKDFNHLSFSYKKSFKIIGSAHNFKEINEKRKQGCSYIILSKLFRVDYAPLENFYGIIKFNLMSGQKELIPLGGIKLVNLNKVKLIKSGGIAIMSEIKKKPAISSRLF